MKFKYLLLLPLLAASLQALDYTGSVSPNAPTSGVSDLIVGDSSPGSLSIRDGEVFSASGFVQVGRSGYGTLDINSGASFQIAEGGNIWIARYLASNGAVVTLNGEGSLLATPAMRLGNSRAGTLNITNNARVEVSGTIQINNNSSVIQISKGGTLQAGQIPMYREREEYGSRGTFTIDLDNAYKSDYAVVSNELGLDHPTKGYASLNITNSNNLIPQNGESFLLFSVDTLLDNSPFRSFPEGSIVYSDEDVKLLITYAGGDGNDITLSVVSDLTFTLNSDGTEYSVTDCLESASGSLVIPSTFNGLPVSSIGDGAFQNCGNLTTITIPDSVTSIGYRAFWQCYGLTSVNVSNANAYYTSNNGVLFNKAEDTLISYPAGKSDEEFTVPYNVTLIGDNAFHSCSSLTSITILDGVTSIGDLAFELCSSLSSITIPNGVTSIGGNAFDRCLSLASITIPSSVTSIGQYAFTKCPSLKSVTFEGDAPTFGTGVFSYSDSATIHYYDDATGFSTPTFQGRPSQVLLREPSQFQIIEADFTWQEAKADAESRGGRLAVLNTQEKINAANSYLGSLGNWPSLWIGLTDEEVEGNWKWITGDLITAENWHTGEPNSLYTREDYGHIFASNVSRTLYSWNDSPSGYDSEGPSNQNNYMSYLLEILSTEPIAPVLDLETFYESNSGESITVDATPTDGYPTIYTYQWYFNGFPIPSFLDGTNATYSIDGASISDGTWRVEVTNDVGTNSAEFEYRVFIDSDSDGLHDADETNIYQTNPNLADSDSDGLNDFVEVNTHSTNPNLNDTDTDGLSDGDEVNTYSTNPLLEDTSGDGFTDGFLVIEGFSPTTDYSPLRTGTVNQIKDLRIGSTIIEVSSGQADITMTLEETSNLNDWSSATTSEKTVNIDAPSGTRFYRFKLDD